MAGSVPPVGRHHSHAYLHHRLVPPTISDNTLNIYNAAINDKKMPHVWKLANIIPIPKPNKDINIGTSYRPISFLSVIAINILTLEKVILPYITLNIPTITKQHRFKTKHSTNTALHNIK